jgi:hypothetical protein
VGSGLPVSSSSTSVALSQNVKSEATRIREEQPEMTYLASIELRSKIMSTGKLQPSLGASFHRPAVPVAASRPTGRPTVEIA